MMRSGCSRRVAMGGGRKKMIGSICWILSVAVILCSFSACYAFPILHNHIITRRQRNFALSMSSAGDDPAMAAIRSLADYHQGEWKGRARSFTITPDVAAGIVQRKLSPEYTVVVKLSTTTGTNTATATSTSATEPATGTISLSETVSWEDKFSHRSVPLFTSSVLSSSEQQQGSSGDLDVDDVDASYSLDSTLPTDFPSVLSGLSGNNDNNNRLQFVVEHCIAAGENRRCRCFAIYGVDESLLRVVISDEKRVKGMNGAADVSNGYDSADDGKIGGKTDILSINDVMEMENDIDRLVDKIAASMNQAPGGSPNTSTRTGENADRGDDDDDDDDDDLPYSAPTAASRLDQLGESIAAREEEDTQQLLPYDMSLLEVTNGIWLGDMIIRETRNVATSPNEGGRGKGFGQTSPTSSSAPSSSSPKSSKSFADWNAGVQKIAWRWMWNFDEEIRQVVDAGKTLGSSMDNYMKKSLAGSVCADESYSRRKPKDERMVYIDWGQDSVGFLLGPFSVQVPRYVNFDPSATTSRAAAVAKPFYTEFGIFQSTLPSNDQSSDRIIDLEENLNLPELCCSKIGRLYNFEGRLKQGCTSFCTFKRFDVDDDDEDDDVEDDYA